MVPEQGFGLGLDVSISGTVSRRTDVWCSSRLCLGTLTSPSHDLISVSAMFHAKTSRAFTKLNLANAS